MDGTRTCPAAPAPELEATARQRIPPSIPRIPTAGIKDPHPNRTRNDRSARNRGWWRIPPHLVPTIRPEVGGNLNRRPRLITHHH